ncbi:MAG: DNA mismatch repair protein MutS [Phycisphaerales bacterium]|nr:DNA mismatch repair protein MutS [Phycisphaerales bacterium]GIK19087.1 MAG: DNA mismatch repair protein MutS [Planctomycetota bacterium]
MHDPRETPAMRQYARFKRQHPDCLLFFRMGDFYELFFDDAVTVSRALGLTLTQRTEGVPMAGVPHHQLENYLRRAVGMGFRVAVAEQVQDPKEAKGVVDRALTRVVTAGTLVDESLLDDASPNRLAALAFTDHAVGIAVVEVSTGAFTVSACSPENVADELARLGVREVLYADTANGQPPERVRSVVRAVGASLTGRPAWHFRHDEAAEALREQFRVATLAGFGLEEGSPEVQAAGVIVRYLRETQTPEGGGHREAAASLSHLRPPRREPTTGVCVVDAVSLRALEVERTLRGGDDTDGSLLGLFMRGGRAGLCRTAMGRRLLRDWLCRPLGERAAIEARQRCVATLVEDRRAAKELGDALERVQDVARIGGRVALARATPRDVVAIARSVEMLAAIAAVVEAAPAFAPQAAALVHVRGGLEPLAARIAEACVESPPPHLREGGLIRDGFDAQLDEARTLQRDAGAWLARYQERIARDTGMPALKVGFNKVFGYYVELTAAQARDFGDALASHGFVRKQTLKNAERYVTPELREFEHKVTTAESRAVDREQELFRELCAAAAGQLDTLREYAETVAELDALLALADKAAQRRWVRPAIADEPLVRIHGGRHPVLDETLGHDFVPNDAEIGGENASLALITGPNMAGKSTYIRQVALIVLLAQVGSFVPADRASIGVFDRIFTRVGADDALHRGQSTFMVEMVETAHILNHATARSLVILDEIGRGTSTLDGLSLAWAVAEWLGGGQHAHAAPITLFATHYHELTDLESRLPGRVMNLRVAVRELTGHDGHPEIVFLHRIEPGRADQSYGIHVARLAGLPRPVVDRAREILASLAVHSADLTSTNGRPAAALAPPDGQLGLFTEYLPHPAVEELRELKLDALTPLEAFDALRRLQQRAALGAD